MSGSFRGVYVIAQTPFGGSGDLIWEDFERECDWIVRAGAHGLVWPVMASEYTVISFPERVQGMSLAVRAVGGRIPVVIGVHDTSKAGAVRLAQEAGKAGADAVIGMPPWATKMASRDLIEDYYRHIAEAGGVPVFIQNCDPPLGSGLAADFVVELCRKIPLVQYLKEEKSPIGRSVSQVIAAGGEEVKGVFSGASCYWIIPEHKRGVSGNMPGCFIPDIDAQIWDLLEAGNEQEARRIHNAKIVLENSVRGMPRRLGKKQVLVRRGVFSCAASRNQSYKLDERDLEELDYALSVVEPYFRV